MSGPGSLSVAMSVEEALRDVFGLAGFRPGQRAVVDSVLAGRHTVAVMPTGAGKSLCYPLPAAVARGAAPVVSRLIALTATATPEVRKDIAKQLGMVDAHMLVRGFDRPNLHFMVDTVRGGSDKLDKLRDRVRGRQKGAALVYAATRKNAETYAEAL